MKFYFRFPHFKKKALTFSYDDGVKQDERFIQIMNRYKLKGTFNLNSGLCDDDNRFDLCDIARVYQGHEIAVHTLNHPHLEHLSSVQMIEEILEDRRNLEKVANTIVDGMAYPFGLCDSNGEPEVAASCGIRYARTVNATGGFGLPRDFLRWNPTCHHGDEKIWKHVDNFLRPIEVGTWRDIPRLLYIWGHSYEFDRNQERNSWEHIEALCQRLSEQDDVWYATNGEIQRYVSAFYQLQSSADGNKLYNPSGATLYLWMNGQEISIAPGCTYDTTERNS